MGKNVNKLMHHLEQIKGISHTNYAKSLRAYLDIATNNIRRRVSEDCIYILEPFYQHERMGVQQGLLIFPANLEKSFPYNLCKAFQMEFNDLSDSNANTLDIAGTSKIDFMNISLLKIVLPYDIHVEAIEHFHQMNISSAILFPGLHGFARSLNYNFRYLEYRMNNLGTS